MSEELKRKKNMRFANKQASLTLQQLSVNPEDVFDIMQINPDKSKGEEELKSDLDNLREISNNFDRKLWNQVVKELETMEDFDKVDYVHKMHNELQLFTKTLKLLDKFLQVDESNVGNVFAFGTKKGKEGGKETKGNHEPQETERERKLQTTPKERERKGMGT